jgi:site-specific DNA-methyltransferase (adenine-specific)
VTCDRKIGPYQCCSVVEGDCLQLMRELPDGCVDAVWFDPPYNVGKDYGATCDDSLPTSEYLLRSGLWVSGAKRIAASVGIYAPNKYLLHYWNELGETARQIILSYSPEGAIRGDLVNQFSVILTTARAVRYEKNVWHNMQMPGLGWFFREDTYGHPGYTSADVTARYLSSFTNEGATVIDLFSGTGTTAAEAKKLGRHFLGFEISPEYCAIARDRLARIDSQPTLFAPKPEQLQLGGGE